MKINDDIILNDCCIYGCDEQGVTVDNLGDAFCEDCATINQNEEPDNWLDE